MLAIVTDSTCGLTRIEATELGVTVVPMSYTVNSRWHEEGFVGENGNYAASFSAGAHVATHAAGASAFARAFRERFDAGDDVLCLTISSRLSGAHRAAEDAVTHLASLGSFDKDRIAVVDSWVTAGALEFLVRRARALADAGSALPQIVDELTELRRGTRIVFSVPDMAALSRSGRLGAIRRAVATKLNRYPVMRLSEGGIEKIGDGRGARGMAAEMVAQAPEGAADLVVSHFGPRGAETREVFLAAKARFPEARIRVKDGGPVLAEHLGLGAVGLSWA